MSTPPTCSRVVKPSSCNTLNRISSSIAVPRAAGDRRLLVARVLLWDDAAVLHVAEKCAGCGRRRRDELTWAHTKRGAARTYTHHAHSLPVSCILSLTFSLTALSLPPSRALLTLSYTHTNSRSLSRLLAHTTTSAHAHTPSHTIKLLHTRSLSIPHTLAHNHYR